ncbi:hypothetical protein [Actinopolyspora mortivallis]|uniref:Uncharacterized protein n=1 Tax=Actinopolyspora mortivallis TaxID=33906 RepID=A0A2T0GYH2_ACTMO|nr:hypothetical protein [Actinopolyspora mortivallis]PRW64154.1 hypothetical protein CEP50_06570 [Actinopolyspora mortivallis]
MSGKGWYFCLKHRRVEAPEEVCRALNRLGPYSDRASAENALEIAHRRTEEADEADRHWGGGSGAEER